MAKTVKTLRLDDLTIQVIESLPGEDFTAKFTFLVQRFFFERDSLESELSSLKERVVHERSRLKELSRKADVYSAGLSSISHYLKNLEKQVD